MKYKYVGELVSRKYLEVEAENYGNARDLIRTAPENDWDSDYGAQLYVYNLADEDMEEISPDVDTLFLALRNLYADYAEYYPSSVDNSPAMKAAREILENGR